MACYTGLSTLTTKPEAPERFMAELRMVLLRLRQCRPLLSINKTFLFPREKKRMRRKVYELNGVMFSAMGVYIHSEQDILTPRYITETSANTTSKVHFQSLRITCANFAYVSRGEG
jgi:hypothetical protein